MMNWMKELQLIAESDYHKGRVVASLATVGLDGTPRGRMVIVRHLDPATGEVWITTDDRSAKVPELATNPSAELVFWAPHERMQFRVRGGVGLVRDGATRDHMWHDLSDASRALFFGPPPGTPRAADAKPPVFVAGGGAPGTFVALVLRPTEAESLELNESPHRRRRWTAVGGWRMELINP